MKRRANTLSPAFLSPALLFALPLAACIFPPTGPSVVALPGPGQSMTDFHAADTTCRNYAQYRFGPTAPANTAPPVGYTDQQRYDVAYSQCMASRGASINNNVLAPSGYAYPYAACPWWPGVMWY